ncbi:MAG: class I SAM-dependent methyltransferase [Solirubrobacteraceae bacterium]|nr:class I SAM-dependent methyltransferase [Solirubrobacteraceae bacterium]
MSTLIPPTGLESSGFHDAECAGYLADLPFWIALSDGTDGPILDLGAGTGRVSIPLAAAGHDVLAVDLDPDLLEELERRAGEQSLKIETVAADLRMLDAQLPDDAQPAALVLIPMQTIQLLGGPDGRRAMFRAAAAVSAPGAQLVISVVTEVEPFDGRQAFPPYLPPDIAHLGGYRFDSTPLAVLQETPKDQIDMHRRRVVRDGDGHIVGRPVDVVITLDPVTIAGLQEEAESSGWEATEVIPMPATDEHAGGTMVGFVHLGADA